MSAPMEEGTKKRKRKQEAQVYKSRSIIEDSDEEAPPLERLSPRKELEKAHKSRLSGKSKSEQARPPTKKSKLDAKSDEESDQGSDDSNEDEPVNLSKQKKPSKPAKPSKKSSKSKSSKSAQSTDKDEETLKRYKALITACGVRKPYAKIFKEKGITDSVRQQVKCLKSILQDEIGMTGRMGMAQAKEIRERRELAQDIAEAEAFTQSVLANGKRTEEQSHNARNSIAAFLQDQSDLDSE